MTKPTKWPVHPAKTQISLGIHPLSLISLQYVHVETKHPWVPIKHLAKTDQTGHTGKFVGFVVLRLKSALWASFKSIKMEVTLKQEN